uniref:Uncharacterized protein n=1 Tax=viral metagenome TaxID=1070528 RepID=A0A6C0B6G5_9ZZZZ
MFVKFVDYHSLKNISSLLRNQVILEYQLDRLDLLTLLNRLDQFVQ